jgi:hypothetical protein
VGFFFHKRKSEKKKENTVSLMCLEQGRRKENFMLFLDSSEMMAMKVLSLKFENLKHLLKGDIV